MGTEPKYYETKEPKFYNKDGSLSSYSLACGKVQRNIFEVQLWKEHFCYHILRRTKTGEFVRSATDSLTEARLIYRQYTREARNDYR